MSGARKQSRHKGARQPSAIRRRNPDAPLVSPDQLAFTVATASKRRPLAKRFWLDANGHLQTETVVALASGTVTVEHAASLEEFAERLDHLGTHQAVMYGLPPVARARVVTQARYEELPPDQRAGVLTRTRQHIQFIPAPGVMMLDFDSAGASSELLAAVSSPDRARALLLEAVPELAAAPMMWRPSSSSYLYKGRRQLHGLRGQRIYIPITHASDIPTLGALIYERLWLLGYGYYIISESGQLLDRTLVDGAVWQPERLDFAAGPVMDPPLIRRAPAARFWNSDASFFEARNAASLTLPDQRSIEAKRNAARRALQDAARERRAQWAAERGKALAARGNIDLAVAVAVAREAVEHQVLRPDFTLTTEDGQAITVRDVLAHPDTWHGRRFCDPLEPDYRGDHRIAYANLQPGTGRPYLYSHAHGGTRYVLADHRPTIRLVQGQLPRIVDECRSIIAAEGEVFQLKDQVVRLGAGDRLEPVTAEWVADWLQRRVDFERWCKNDWVPADLTPKYAKTLLAKRGELGLPSLLALTQGPFMRADGTVVDQPGYDAATEVLYRPSQPHAPVVRRDVTPAMAVEALRRLWAPFSAFPFEGDVDRGVVLALLLTAAVRPAIAIAPAGLIESHDAGSGKTLAARAIANLTGVPAVPQAMAQQEEEIRKALFAVARAGSPAVFFDNVGRERPVDSASLAMALTSGAIADRILGESTHAAVPFRSLLLLTGNNVRIVGDLNRRILRARITPNVEHPWKRVFPFDPRAQTEATWLNLRVAALELIRAGLGHGSVAFTAGSGYPEWDHLVRRTVCWVGQHLDIGVGFGDPVESLLSGYEQDPERDRLRRLFTAWYAVFGDGKTTVGQALHTIESEHYVPNTETPLTPRQEAMELLREVLGEVDHRRKSHRIGIYLDQHKGQIADGLQLINGGKQSGSSLWLVRRHGVAESSP